MIKKYPAHKFTWTNYCSKMGYSGHEAIDHKTQRPKEGWTILGYCDAMKLQVRPRGGAAVMLENEFGEKVWFHTYFSEKQLKKFGFSPTFPDL